MDLSRRFKWIASIVGGCAAAILIAAVGIWWYSHTVVSAIRDSIAEIFPAASTSVGEIAFDPLTSEVVISRLAVCNPPGYSSERPAILIGEIRAVINAPALLRHVIHIRELRLRRCEFSLEFRDIPLSTVDWLLIVLRGPGINLYDIMTDDDLPQQSGSASGASPSGSPRPRQWFLRIDRGEITRCRVFFGNLEQFHGLAEAAAAKFFANVGVKGKTGDNLSRMAADLLLRQALNFFRNGIPLQDYRLPKPVGQDDISSPRDVAEEIFRAHWDEIATSVRTTCERFQKQCRAILEKMKPRFSWRSWGRRSAPEAPAEPVPPAPENAAGSR